MPNASIPFDPAEDLPVLCASGALDGNVAQFAQPRGPDLLRRSGPLDAWCALRARHGVWPCARVPEGPPQPLATAGGEAGAGEPVRGINSASQDYLSLAAHPAIADAALRALGGPSPIVPVWMGIEAAARVAGMLLARDTVFVNPVEYPGVPLGAARLRLQLMTSHTPAQVRRAAPLVAAAAVRAGATHTGGPRTERRR